MDREESEMEFCANCIHSYVDDPPLSWDCDCGWRAEWDEEHEGWDCPKMKWRREEWLD